MAVLAQGPPRHTAMGLCLGSGIFWRKKVTVGSPISVFCYVYCLVVFFVYLLSAGNIGCGVVWPSIRRGSGVVIPKVTK